MAFYWYVARNDELMCDLDSQTLLEIAMKRLTAPATFEIYPDLEPRNVFLADSNSAGHFHMVVQLKQNMPAMRRMIYQLYLMDHVYRSVKNLTRALESKPAPSLLISPHNWLCNGVALGSVKFWRSPDAICHCHLSRHKSQEKIWECPAHIQIRGKKNF